MRWEKMLIYGHCYNICAVFKSVENKCSKYVVYKFCGFVVLWVETQQYAAC